MNTQRIELAKRFDRAIKESGMKYGEIAKKADLPAHVVAQARNPKGAQGSMQRLEKLASVLGVAIHEEKPEPEVVTQSPNQNGVMSVFVGAAREIGHLNPSDRSYVLTCLVKLFAEN